MGGAAEIICVGTEILLGDILNSNAQYLAQQLAALGIPHYVQTVVGDNPDRIRSAVAIACQRSQLLIFTGGLGPTPDDLTIETLAQFFGASMVEQPEVVADIRQRFADRGVEMTPNNLKQALIPIGAQRLPNPTGTAPGIIWEPRSGLVLMTFPGIPSEMKRMWQETAAPYLQAKGWSTSTFVSRTLLFWGQSESGIATRVAPFFDQQNPTVAPYANHGQVKLRITAKAETIAEGQALIAPTEAKLRAIVGIDCFGADGDTLASVVGQLLRDRQQTLAVAESCTGGGLGQAITTVPGCSDYFWGGVISYDNQIKTALLGVSEATLAEHGAVSPIVAEQMAAGVRDRLGTDWGLSITGVAGPGGGTEAKPVGLVYIGIAGPIAGQPGVVHHRCTIGGQRGRDWVRNISANTALDRLRRILLKVD
jgi:nicotinamide-nucleotide amidase